MKNPLSSVRTWWYLMIGLSIGWFVLITYVIAHFVMKYW